MTIEKASHSSYADFIRRVFSVLLGLTDTCVPTDNKFGSNVSSGYNIERADNKMENYSSLDLSMFWSAGAIISTVSDPCNWVTSMGTGKIVLKDMQAYVYWSIFPTNCGITEPCRDATAN